MSLKSCLLHKVGASWHPELLLNYPDTFLGNVSPDCSLMLLHFVFCHFLLSLANKQWIFAVICY